VPFYETPEDRAQERSVGRHLSKAWGVDIWSFTPHTTTGDLLLGRENELKAICEVKTRNNPIAQYETYIISRNKLERISQAAETFNTKGLLVVRFDDCLCWHDAQAALDYPTEVGGRYDRGDHNDIELMVHIPIEKLRKVKNGDYKGSTY